MAKFNYSEIEHYGGQGGAGFFSLKNDKDVARVRFMYKDINDVEGCSVHQIEINGRLRNVNCIREYGESLDKCPFCKEHRPQYAKLFIPLYNEDTGQVQIWERGKKFISKLTSLCARYNNLASHVFEIERNGARGDTQTTYEIYEVGNDNKTLNDLPERPDIMGSVILEKSYEDMEFYNAHGYFPNENDENTFTRRNTNNSSEGTYQRRTPADSDRRDKF